MKLGVPTLCRYDLLERLLDSVERGTVRAHEYIIVDNGPDPGVAKSIRLPPNTRVIRPGRNLGVAASWNVLLECAGDAPIVISNDDVTLGPTAFAELQEASQRHPLVTAPDWQLFTQAPECVARAGWYDEGFYPAYYEDSDYDYRLRLCGVERHVINVDHVHVRSATIEVARHISSERSALYYRAKWGGPPGEEQYTEPFGGAPPAGWGTRNRVWEPPREPSIHDYIYGRNRR